MGRSSSSKWYKTAESKSKHTGWKKSYPAKKRRTLALKGHKSTLSAGRALQALANVTQDEATRKAAQADAKYFYKKHRGSK